MVKTHVSETRFAFPEKYDSFLADRRNSVNRYYVLFLFFYKDYFIGKIVTKLMKAGGKARAFIIFKNALFRLKRLLGFQPFFFSKHISFRMRQLFKVQTKTIRERNVTYLPLLLRPHNQVNYGINHVIKCAHQVASTDKKTMPDALCVVLLNCFITTIK